MNCPKCDKKISKHLKFCPYCNAKVVGIVNGVEMNTAKNYVEEKFHDARGHGFAAENANDLYDRFTGKDSRIVGGDNAKDGADRIVNGMNIQSKYCSSGSKCIQECFRDGKFRYYNPDGTPMQIEVPSDKYEDAVKAMQNRINRGEIKGVERAEEIIRKGNVTYEQAKNIAKAGTIESLTYDAVNGVQIGAYSGGISAAITFAISSWNGKNFNVALKDSVKAGLQVGGVAWASSILVGQMAKAGLNSMLVAPSDAIVHMIGSKLSANLVNAFRSGTNIYGTAAMRSASKLLRSNVMAGIATVAIMSVGDVVNIFRGRISKAQLFKNVVNTSAGVAGGVGGWMGGAATGAAIGSAVPVIGTAIGGVVGGLIGSFAGRTAANKVSHSVTDKFIEDDSKEMVRILEREFTAVSFDYLLNKDEAEKVVAKLQSNLDGATLKDMYSSDNRNKFARELIEKFTIPVVINRPVINLPTSEDYVQGLRQVLE